MSATGNEVVTLSQLKEAISQSSQSGIVMVIKPLYRDDKMQSDDRWSAWYKYTGEA